MEPTICARAPLPQYYTILPIKAETGTIPAHNRYPSPYDGRVHNPGHSHRACHISIKPLSGRPFFLLHVDLRSGDQSSLLRAAIFASIRASFAEPIPEFQSVYCHLIRNGTVSFWKFLKAFTSTCSPGFAHGPLFHAANAPVLIRAPKTTTKQLRKNLFHCLFLLSESLLKYS